MGGAWLGGESLSQLKELKFLGVLLRSAGRTEVDQQIWTLSAMALAPKDLTEH